jgi:hypothetical protein
VFRVLTNHNNSALSPRSSPPRVSYPLTAVRHSSLLRFAQNAESLEDVSSSEAELPEFPESPRSPKLHLVTYRSRSQTYPWVESEADDELPSGGSAKHQYPVDELANLAIGQPQTPYIPPKSKYSTPLSAEAREFTPLELPSRNGSPNSQVSAQFDYQAEIPRITPTLIASGPPITPPRRSSLANQLRSSSNYPSYLTSSSASLPAALPATPSPVRIHQPTQTEPRSYHAYGGHPRLSIFNDQLPSTQQPQTPADLARRPILTDRDTAYTAPPGIVGRRRAPSHDTSPTTRGRELRARWTREYQRAEIIERGREERMEPTLWLDEWAADRVGEENSYSR